MPKRNARELLVKLGTGATPTYALIAGLTTRSITLNTNQVDVTSINKDDPGGPVWRELISGINSMDVSGNGFFEEADQFFALYDAQQSSSGNVPLQIVMPGAGTFTGKFNIPSIDISGGLEGAVSQSLTLQSSGKVEFVRETVAP